MVIRRDWTGFKVEQLKVPLVSIEIGRMEEDDSPLTGSGCHAGQRRSRRR